jgi:translation initiation factor 1
MSGKSTRLTGGAGWGITRECPGCGRPQTACSCSATPAAALPPTKQLARLRLEKRCGKTVTVVAGLVLGEAELRGLLKELKARCGAGGTAKDGDLEIQGDQRESVREFLTAKGFRCKGG